MSKVKIHDRSISKLNTDTVLILEKCKNQHNDGHNDFDNEKICDF